VEKTIDACIKLRERLKKVKREKRNRITFAVAFCIVAGIITSQFLIIGFSIWMLIAFLFVWALIMSYSVKEAQVNQNMKKLGCKN
jgi:cell division protein FtsL